MDAPVAVSSSSEAEGGLASPVSLELTDEAPLDSSTAASPLSSASRTSSSAQQRNSSSGFCPMCSSKISADSTHTSCSQRAHHFQSFSGKRSPLSMVVRFKDINVTVEHTEPDAGYDTFGKMVVASFLGLCIKMVRSRKKTTEIKVLKDICGYVMPGSMTVVLGPPGSGKSTLLKVIGGKLRPNKRIRLDGDVLYNNNILSSGLEVRRPIAYITQQENVHLPFFTVRETVEFVHQCAQWKNTIPHFADRPDAIKSSDSYVDYILQRFGLKEMENQRVGTVADGIKDSERNRLTTAEIAMGAYSVMLYDQASSGQDSLMTYDLLQMLQTVIHLHQCAAVLSLVQISPECFNLFDRVILLSEGQILYQGPRQDADSYFLKLGYKRPAYVDVGTFLQDIASGGGAMYMERNSPALSIDDLLQHFKTSDYFKDVYRVASNECTVQTAWVETSSGVQVSMQGNDVLVTEMPTGNGADNISGVHVGDRVTAVCLPGKEFQYAESREESLKVLDVLKTLRSSALLQLERTIQESENISCSKKQFGRRQLLTWWLLTKCLIKRESTFAFRLRVLAIIRLFQVLILGLFIGTLFYHKGGRIDQYEMNSMRTIGFISMMSLMLVNIVQLPVHIMLHRPVFYKQQAQRLFCPSSYIVAHGLINLPQSFMEATVYTLCVYFLGALSKERAAHYFQYWGLVFLIAYLGSVYMIFVSAIAPVLEIGTTIAGLFIALNLMFSGSTILPSVVGWYWRWILYIMPTRWGNVIFSSTQVDERYELPCTGFRTYPFCLLNPSLSLGRAFLKFYEIEANGRRLFLAYAVIVLFILVLILLTYLAYSRIQIRAATPSIPRQKHQMDSKVPNLQEAENGGFTGVKWNSNLSVKAVTVSFHKLTFIRTDSDQASLTNVSGYAKPGAMLALVGSTRSGKKTLLNCIAGRLPPGRLEGDVLVNGFKLDKLTFCRISGFVEKLEAHQQFLTVKESLEFSAKLRLGDEVSAKNKAHHVDQVLELLGLRGVSDQLVGNLKLVTSRVNEMTRKLSIAVELAVNPSILFLEDPTAQLDGVASREILQLLQSVALSGRTIISTVDHPSGEALSLFNDVLILKLGGHEVYFGAVGWNCKQLLEYFTSIPKLPPYNENWNPVSYILEALGGGIKKRDPVADFALVYLQSPLHRANEEELNIYHKQQDSANDLRDLSSRYPASYTTQTAMVFSRNRRFLWRNVRYTFGRLFGIILISLIMGTLYLNINTEKLLSMTSGSLFPYIQLIMITGLTANNVIPQLGTDRLVYYRENRARMYTPVLYPMSWAAAEIPYLLLGTLVFVAIGNGLANLAMDSFSAFFSYWFGLLLFTLAVTYFGIFVTLLFPVPLLSVTTASIFTSIWITASGVSVPRHNIQFYKWLYWIDPYQYAVNILTTAAFFCDTTTEACKACRIGAACPGCSCKRLVDLESKLVSMYGPVLSQMIPASFVWDRMSKARVIEKERNGRDFVALLLMVLLFATLSFVAFARLKHNSK